ncbi:hypothetical protein MO973_08510 [Paenibacillus sp. TRM 82003]|nr:hypothetical protein [Paenibacillus sp. TRM 82003]
MRMSESMERAIETIAGRLPRCETPWLIGGSCGLLLQGVEVPTAPRDLDVYVDAETNGFFHGPLSSYATDAPQYSETDKYRSTLSHYRIEDVTVELVAGFEVFVPGASYRVAVQELLLPLAVPAEVRGAPVRLMPLSHELLFNALRDRPDRYEAIATAMRAAPDRHLPALRAIVHANELDRVWLAQLASLLDVEPDVLRFEEEGQPGCP